MHDAFFRPEIEQCVSEWTWGSSPISPNLHFLPTFFFFSISSFLFFSFSFSFFFGLGVCSRFLIYSQAQKLVRVLFSLFLLFSRVLHLYIDDGEKIWMLVPELWPVCLRDKQHTCNRLYSILLFTWLSTPDPIANCYCDERTYSISLSVVWGQRKKEKEKKGKCPSVLNSWLIVC